MDDFKSFLDNSQETFGALDEESSDVELTITLQSGETITTNAIGVDPEQNICRYFDWMTLSEELVRGEIENEDVTFEEIEKDPNVEIGSKFVLMDGMIPWNNVSYVECDTDLIF